MVESANRLGEYLRARRELVRPEDVGLPAVGRRRVPGLRREELALLAGISSDYYLRLEQGRDRHPSAQVLDSLARVLRLDDDATAHLHRLARPTPRRRRPRRPERVPAGIQQLVMSWTRNPAFVQGRYMDILFANPLAIALSPLCRPGVNVVRALFLDPEIHEAHGSETATAGVVAALRALVGPDVEDPPLAELVGELSVKSERFRRLWARHDVKPKAGSGTSTFQHPQVGPLELSYEKLAVTGTEGQLLVVYHAVPGSPAEQALALLSGLAGDVGGAGDSGNSGGAEQSGRSSSIGSGAAGREPSPNGWLRS
ncbi:helix-turn-helix domain-containing protein [Streptomyces sp. SID8382]|uniref:helix-turn-helix domain-containing protein n=1 Tax=Streptomyces malaysiensis TaxID=92644 RepID=UPI000C2C1268|nr:MULTISPECIES: helix-turn-helix transcriptional regulator [unclassified Streptomyces]MYX63655.1 helix-turn-helix domain-containing protein [Streptomyces sp. SID8382]